MSEKQISISKIVNGTVIDHIPAGRGSHVLRLLRIEPTSLAVTASNVNSKKYGKKDLIKIEDKHLTAKELNIISLIAPNATISKIENSNVKEKYSVKFPEFIEGVLKCPNLSCISNMQNEPVVTKFSNVSGQSNVQCYYCDSLMSYEEIVNNLNV